jgi:DnaJ-class molecular chaperone
VLVLSENLKGVMQMSQTKENQRSCPYCEGKGYFQLLLGGSETCGSCSGTGKSSSQ